MGKIVEDIKLQKLRTAGFTGKSELEDLMIPLNEKMAKAGLKMINGRAWWIDLKDKSTKSGITFEDAVISELEKELKVK